MKMKKLIDKRLAGLRLNVMSAVPRPMRIRRPLAAAAAVCLCILIAVPVMGATMPEVNNIIAQVSPDIAQRLAPIQLTYEDQEVEITVRAAISDGYVSAVYMDMSNYMVEISEGNYCNAYFLSDWSGAFNEYWGMGTIDNTERVRLIGTDEDLRGKKITLHFFPVKNKWQITFKMQTVEPLEIDCHITHGKMGFNHILLSPIGITLTGAGPLDSPPPELTVTMLDGTIQPCDLVLFTLTNVSPPWEYRVCYAPVDGPFDMSQIKEVLMDGEPLPIGQ